jgi:hypothetical protein
MKDLRDDKIIKQIVYDALLSTDEEDEEDNEEIRKALKEIIASKCLDELFLDIDRSVSNNTNFFGEYMTQLNENIRQMINEKKREIRNLRDGDRRLLELEKQLDQLENIKDDLGERRREKEKILNYLQLKVKTMKEFYFMSFTSLDLNLLKSNIEKSFCPRLKIMDEAVNEARKAIKNN